MTASLVDWVGSLTSTPRLALMTAADTRAQVGWAAGPAASASGLALALADGSAAPGPSLPDGVHPATRAMTMEPTPTAPSKDSLMRTTVDAARGTGQI